MKKSKICIFGLGYVGLPLAIEFAKKYNVVGFDKNHNRIKQLNLGKDINKEFSKPEIIKNRKNLFFTFDIKNIKKSDFYIVAVPTPIKKNLKPDLFNLKSACLIISKILKLNSIVIFESTVYPGLTEEFCVPLLERNTSLKYNKDFFCGYSPERINPGDKFHQLNNIVKITSGSNKVTSRIVDQLYKSIIKAGTYNVKNIKIAEAAKVIENTQRDLNIAFVNELSIIFDKLKLNTNEVLEAASTKWNFLNFKPGLVGGHCIGVDPFYLTYKSKKEGYTPKFILSGRFINDNMSKFVCKKIFKSFKENNKNLKNSKILIMGLSFKENCSDTRNSKVFDIINYFIKNKVKINIFDPCAENLIQKYNKYRINKLKKHNYYDAIIITVGHKIFKKIGVKKIKSFAKRNSIFFDLKNIFKIKISSRNLIL